MSALCPPPEILDSIMNIADRKTLERCCLAKKSWVPLARRHLFKRVDFKTDSHLVAWGNNFPNPETSPAIYTRSLCVYCAELVTDEDDWFRSFTHVVRLVVRSGLFPSQIPASLSPFHNISPGLKSLRLAWYSLPLQEVFDLICSFPLLEDLDAQYDHKREDGIISRPSYSPKLTGTLVLQRKVEDVVYLLSKLPNGSRFRKIVLKECDRRELKRVRGLVERCSDTLESVDIECSGLFDLSAMPKLKEVALRFECSDIRWVVATLDTVNPERQALQQVSIYLPLLCISEGIRPADFKGCVGREAYRQWMHLGHSLIQLQELYEIDVRVVCNVDRRGAEVTHEHVECMLSQTITKGGIKLSIIHS